MNVIGIDLAWQSIKSTSAAAVGYLDGGRLSIHELKEDLNSIKAILDFVTAQPEVGGIAIDAPLIIANVAGQRSCEKELSRVYGGRKASCHTSNLTLYPDPPSVALANAFGALGFEHLGDPERSRWQIECYPHPAIIELFDLSERLKYKKGRTDEKKDGQIRLAELIKGLAESRVLKLDIDDRLSGFMDEPSIRIKRGAAIKRNEDSLDAIICTYIAALYALGAKSAVYGNVDDGYIYGSKGVSFD